MYEVDPAACVCVCTRACVFEWRALTECVRLAHYLGVGVCSGFWGKSSTVPPHGEITLDLFLGRFGEFRGLKRDGVRWNVHTSNRAKDSPRNVWHSFYWAANFLTHSLNVILLNRSSFVRLIWNMHFGRNDLK